MESDQLRHRLRQLVSELDRQAQQCTMHDSPASGEVIKGLTTLQSQGADYAHALRELQSSITDWLAKGKDLHAIPMSNESLLWKVCAFSESLGCFADPDHVRERTTSLLDLVERRSKTNDTKSIWHNEKIKEWVISDRPFPLLLEIPYPGPERVRRFTLDLIDHLEKLNYPVIHMASGMGKSEAEVLFPSLSPKAVLEYLVLQALRRVTLAKPVLCLADALHSLSTAVTCLDVLCLLQKICSCMPRLFVILDLSVLSKDFDEDLASWPAEFADLTMNLWKSSRPRFCQVMLLGFRRSFAKQDLVVSVNSVAQPKSQFPFPQLKKPEPKPFVVPIELGGVGGGEVWVERESKPHTQKVLLNRHKRSLENTDNIDTLRSGAGITTRSTTQSRRRREDIQLAIFCALPLEANAVKALFEEQWEDVNHREMRSSGDINAYSFGIFGRFPTVLVHMPGMGKVSGSIVATNCRNSFLNIKLALVVGICGGVPSCNKGETEIVLGDVVISEGLVSYDFGRRYPDRFRRKDSASDISPIPPFEVRGLLQKLMSHKDRQDLQQRTAFHLGTLKRKLGDEALYLGSENDQLFESTYVHRHRSPESCEVCSDDEICDAARKATCGELSCDKRRLVDRKRLGSFLKPYEHNIHFGHIASGDQVMKSGRDRDRIAQEDGVIAFEMEGAGVWAIFPCLVIKGVCDYADSHKHKKWQVYAAATAAACARALVQEWFM